MIWDDGFWKNSRDIVFVVWLTDERSESGPLLEILTIANLQHAASSGLVE